MVNICRNERRIVDDIIEQFRSVKPDRSIIIESDRSLPACFADLGLLRHIVRNLISNAVKYSEYPAPVVVRYGHSLLGDLFFEVEDYGIGISEEEQERLFEPFYRARNVGAISGTGLGLAILKRSVDTLDGHIVLHSGLNQGTKVRVTLPIFAEGETTLL